MASETLIKLAVKLGKQLGANTSKFLGTKSNITFMGSGPKDGMLFQKSIDPESFATIGVEKILPDIIFMDIQMPLMNGYEATKEIRKLASGASLPIIAITAGTEMEVKEKCKEAGMNDYISKPIIKSVIEDTIIKWMV